MKLSERLRGLYEPDAIEEAADLLDECERALEEAIDWMHTDWDETDKTCIHVEATLAKLREQESN